LAIDTSARTEVQDYKNYIGGEWVEAASRETFDITNPATEDVFATVPKCDREDARRAIEAARRAFDEGPWATMEPDERKRILLSVIERFSALEDQLATIETMQAGMTIRATSTVVIGYCMSHWDYFSRQAARPTQEALEPVSYPTHSHNFVLREPIGVCAGIIPWNFPLVMAVWKLAPALAMGNTCVLKPASNTPLTALKLAEILAETELPEGVVNVITGGGSTVGEELASNPGVDKVAFTGSTVVGRRIMQLASSTIKKTTLELGGKSPNIVFEDADMDQAVDGALWATFFHQGQVCESGTRLLLPESIHDEFVDRLVERAKQIKVGDPMDYESDLGPLVSAAQLETSRTTCASARRKERSSCSAGSAPRATGSSAATGSSRRSSRTSTTR
jgi:acyl-CoA reductase-like NAD-dependent aldehyde dehydrogenase